MLCQIYAAFFHREIQCADEGDDFGDREGEPDSGDSENKGQRQHGCIGIDHIFKNGKDR